MVSELLTELAACGGTLTRLATGQLRATGELSDSLKARLREHRDELLQLLPAPATEARRIWDRAVEQAHDLVDCNQLSQHARQQLATIKSEYERARATDDLDSVRRAAAKYTATIHKFHLIEEAARWAEAPRRPAYAWSCGWGHRRFWLSAIGGHWVCGTCHPPVSEGVVERWAVYCRCCGRETDEPLCTYCGEPVENGTCKSYKHA